MPDALVAARTPESFARRAEQRIGDITLATVDGRIAGFVAVVADEVEQVYVASEYRGTGLAPVLLSEAEQQVAGNGFEEAWLAAAGGNARARRFYARCGWIDNGPFEYEAYTEAGPMRITAYRYTRRVTKQT